MFRSKYQIPVTLATSCLRSYNNKADDEDLSTAVRSVLWASPEVVRADELWDGVLDVPFSNMHGLSKAGFMLACGSGN